MSKKLVETSTIDGRAVRVFQRYVEAGYGPTPSEVYYECDAPNWPKVRIRGRRRLWLWLLKRFSGPGLELDDAAFNKAFRVDAEDDDFAIALLTPEMQHFLLEKRNVDWSVGRGALKLFYGGRLKRKRMPESLERLQRFWQHVPDALHAW